MAPHVLVLEAYRGFGTPQRALMMGRIYREPAHGRGFGARLRRRGAGGVAVTGTLAGHTASARTDRDGYFRLDWRDASLPPGWQPVELHAKGQDWQRRGVAEVHVRGAASRFVTISDIDDTVMVTGVANKAAMYWRLFFRDASRRRAFPGVPDFYRALRDGAGGEDNPVVFVSRGPWSIYDVLSKFFRDNGIAERPVLMLREWGLTLQSPLPRRARDHKPLLVDDVMAVYGDGDYVLIGDDGQHDPELYARVATAHPSRIRAVYIRRIDRAPARRAAVEQLFSGGPPLVVAEDTADMVRHARETGLIAAPGDEA